MAYSEEELAALTDEEREGLLDEDLLDDEPEGDEDDGDDAGKPAADAGADDADAAGRDDGADPDDGTADAQPEAEASNAPALIKSELPADLDAKLADIDKREDELSEKFEDGELTTAEYRAELRKLTGERGEIEKAQLKHSLAEDFNQAQLEANWQRDCDQFLAKHPEVKSSQLRMDAFDTVVRRVTGESMAAGKAPGMADLQKAYAEWSEQLGVQPAKPSAKDAKPAKHSRELPPTLAKVPAAEMQDTADGKWAHLDRLMDTDPLGYEAALAKMSEADQDAYLSAR